MTKKAKTEQRTEKEIEALREQSNREYEADVVRSAKENHIWVNAFACIRPTDELKRQIGESILNYLNDKDSTILSSISRPGHVLEEVEQQELVIRINKS